MLSFLFVLVSTATVIARPESSPTPASSVTSTKAPAAADSRKKVGPTCSEQVVCTRTSSLATSEDLQGEILLNPDLKLRTTGCKTRCRTEKVESVSKYGGKTPFISRRYEKCKERYSCYGSQTHVERYLIRTGQLREHQEIDGCSCVNKRAACQRVSKHVTYYAGTSYERTIDHGKCIGKCDKNGRSCIASAHRSLILETPNGPRTVEVVDSCSCESSCYRVSHYDVFSETTLNETTSEIVTTTKTIDVGKCVGNCPAQKRSCYRLGPNFQICGGELAGHETLCFATQTRNVIVNRVDSDPLAVTVVKSCGCSISAV